MRLWLPLVLLCASAAFAQDVDIQFDETVNFANYKTFRIVSGDIDAKSPALNNDIVKRNLENEIRTRFKAKGLTEVATQPDLNVRFHLGSARRTEATAIPAGRLGRQRRVVRTQYTEGTLTIDLLAQRELVWRAIATEDEKDPTKVAGRLDDMVKKAIDKYPPKK